MTDSYYDYASKTTHSDIVGLLNLVLELQHDNEMLHKRLNELAEDGVKKMGFVSKKGNKKITKEKENENGEKNVKSI